MNKVRVNSYQQEFQHNWHGVTLAPLRSRAFMADCRTRYANDAPQMIWFPFILSILFILSKFLFR